MNLTVKQSKEKATKIIEMRTSGASYEEIKRTLKTGSHFIAKILRGVGIDHIRRTGRPRMSGERFDKLKSMLADGSKIKDIAAAVGISDSSVFRIAKRYDIKRPPRPKKEKPPKPIKERVERLFTRMPRTVKAKEKPDVYFTEWTWTIVNSMVNSGFSFRAVCDDLREKKLKNRKKDYSINDIRAIYDSPRDRGYGYVRYYRE